MKTGAALLILASISALYGLFCMVQMLRYLSLKGEKVSFFLLRLKWFNCMSRYRELTAAENGYTGKHHKGYIISMLAALVFAIAGALLLDH
jgi:hypothetical protein